MSPIRAEHSGDLAGVVAVLADLKDDVAVPPLLAIRASTIKICGKDLYRN